MRLDGGRPQPADLRAALGLRRPTRARSHHHPHHDPHQPMTDKSGTHYHKYATRSEHNTSPPPPADHPPPQPCDAMIEPSSQTPAWTQRHHGRASTTKPTGTSSLPTRTPTLKRWKSWHAPRHGRAPRCAASPPERGTRKCRRPTPSTPPGRPPGLDHRTADRAVRRRALRAADGLVTILICGRRRRRVVLLAGLPFARFPVP